jgi:hypothetical protein
MITLLVSGNMKEDEDDFFEDPAKTNPWKRFVIRDFTTNFILYTILIIPALVFYIVTILLGLSTTIGILFAFVSFLILIYLTLKKELWNKIKR